MVYDCTGRAEAFVLATCCAHRTYRIGAPRLARLLLLAMRHGLRVVVVTCPGHSDRVEQVLLRP